MKSPFEEQIDVLEDEFISPLPILNPFPVESVGDYIRGFTFYYDK